MLDHNLVLKSDELFLAGDISHDEYGDLAKGLYLRDTRHLDRFEVRLGDQPPETLASQVVNAATAVIAGANRLFGSGADRILPLTVSIEQRVTLSDRLRLDLTIHNHNVFPIRLPLVITWASDFRDMFDIRGFPRSSRGTVQPPVVRDGTISLSYVGLDGRTVGTDIVLDRPARVETAPTIDSDGAASPVELPGLDRAVTAPVPEAESSATAVFDLDLSAGERWALMVTATPRAVPGRSVSAQAMLPAGLPPRPAVASTSNALFNRLLDRSRADLLMLQTSFPEGSLPAAGIPWFVAPFGRDSLIVGLQTVHFAPARAEGTLRVLAALQGTRDDPWRDEEPGKIMHEVRYGEMARLGEVPHTPYYGTVDATPLFVLLFAETVAWTADETLYRDLLPNVKRALEWIEGPGDADEDGLVEYSSRSAEGVRIVHQGWKDSHDSLHHVDGTPANAGAIALVEVQGYVFAAYRRLGEVARHHGDDVWAAELYGKAERVRALVEDRFWMEDQGFYAQALDQRKGQVRSISSNPGHLLFCGLPSTERARKVADRLLQPDFFTGWGIRTLESTMLTYNPMSYHNGTVWPHDNSLIAAGLGRYGFTDHAAELITALVDAAATDPLLRLPELFCGFQREGGPEQAPVPYPVSCSPQAWAAATFPLLVATMLDLRIDLDSDRATIDPALPPWLDELTVHGLAIRGTRASLTVRRRGVGHTATCDGPIVVKT